MTLQTRYRISLGVFVGLLLFLTVGMLITVRQVQRLNHEENLAETIERTAAELDSLLTDYFLQQDPRQRTRWEAQNAAITAALAALRPAEPERQAQVAAIRLSQQRLQAMFAEVAATLDQGGNHPSSGIDPAFFRLSWSRMNGETQRMVLVADRIGVFLREEADRWTNRNILLVFVLVGAFGLYLLALYALTFRRTLTAIAALQAGTRALGAGNLDVRIAPTGRDEIGALGDAFNQMAASLQQVTASKADLERVIAERQRAEEELRHLNATLEQRVQARTADLVQKASQLQALSAELSLVEQRERQRLALVLHDGLQQLLVAAKLRVTFLSQTDPARVADGCRELTDLLEEMLTACRTLTGELSPPILQTGGLMAGLEWLVRWKAEKYHLAVELDTDPLAVPDSEAMTLLLFQSIRELLFNVVKHAQVHTARVEVSRQDGHLQIVVSDKGVGFDLAMLSATRIGGLGFSSTRQRVEFLGGRVDIVTAPGQGCRVTLAVPLRSQANAPAPPAKSAASPFVHRSPREDKIRVLLVDDHAVVRQALAQLLRQEPDLDVVGEAADGKAGVERTKELQPDVVLMDTNMPVLNGMEATQQIHAACPGVLVIGLSMFESAEQTSAMRRAGLVAYVSKSAPAEELLAAIRTAVGATFPSSRPPHARPAGS